MNSTAVVSYCASQFCPCHLEDHPAWTDELTYAGELVAIIDKRCRDVAPEAVPDIIRGYTIVNDVDALDQQGRTVRKAFDTSGPLGPLETNAKACRFSSRRWL